MALSSSQYFWTMLNPGSLYGPNDKKNNSEKGESTPGMCKLSHSHNGYRPEHNKESGHDRMANQFVMK